LKAGRWVYGMMARKISPGELVRILVRSKQEARVAGGYLTDATIVICGAVQFVVHPTNRAWMRDSGPIS